MMGRSLPMLEWEIPECNAIIKSTVGVDNRLGAWVPGSGTGKERT